MVDTRIELFDSEVWNDYLAVAAGRADWAQILDRWEVTFAALEADHDDLIPFLEAIRRLGSNPRGRRGRGLPTGRIGKPDPERARPRPGVVCLCRICADASWRRSGSGPAAAPRCTSDRPWCGSATRGSCGHRRPPARWPSHGSGRRRGCCPWRPDSVAVDRHHRTTAEAGVGSVLGRTDHEPPSNFMFVAPGIDWRWWPTSSPSLVTPMISS